MSAPERELEIQSLAAGGDGVGRDAEGRVVFVPFSAPGDRLRVRIVEERASFARAETVEILHASPARTAPACPVFGSCGGCAWQHLSYEAQLDGKARILRDALARIGGLDVPEPVVLHPSPTPYGYRGRARILVEGGRVGFRQSGSRELCAIRHCPILVPALDALLEGLAEDGRPDAEWEIAAGDAPDAPSNTTVCRVGGRSAGRGSQRLRISNGNDWLQVSAGGFFQAHAGLRPVLGAAVAEAAGSGEACLELYAGAGFFTLLLAARFGRLVAVEASRGAARDLRRNLAAAGRKGASVQAQPVEQALRDPALRRVPLDAVVLDPPRIGLARGAAASLAELGAQRLVYLSCDPATLARDLAILVAGGYRLERVAGFDCFPQTPHVEALAILERVALRARSGRGGAHSARAPSPSALRASASRWCDGPRRSWC